MSATDPGDGVRTRPARERLRTAAGGIAAVEAFSRGEALDRAWMGWGPLRVLSRQDWAPGAVRDEGRVANMERLLLVLDGALDADCGALGRHRVGSGEALWLQCGHGVEATLANASARAPLRLLDCWLQPARVNASPAVARGLPEGAGTEAGVALVGIDAGDALDLPATASSRGWLEVIEGEVDVADHGRLGPGDGLAWNAGATGAPARLVPAGPRPARVLLLRLSA